MNIIVSSSLQAAELLVTTYNKVMYSSTSLLTMSDNEYDDAIHTLLTLDVACLKLTLQRAQVALFSEIKRVILT